MGWSGYSQNWCERGHYFTGGAGHDGEPKECAFCRGRVARCHIVDTTNDDWGVIPDDVLKSWQLTPERMEACSLGHRHVVEYATYKIPTKEEISEVEYVWYYESGELIRIKDLPSQKENEGIEE